MKIVLEAADEEWLTRVLVTALREASRNDDAERGGEVMTLDEVAEYTRVSVSTLRYWRSAGINGPPGHKRGRRIYYKRADVEAWMTKGGS